MSFGSNRGPSLNYDEISACATDRSAAAVAKQYGCGFDIAGGSGGSISSLAIGPFGNMLITGGKDTTLKVLDRCNVYQPTALKIDC